MKSLKALLPHRAESVTMDPSPVYDPSGEGQVGIWTPRPKGAASPSPSSPLGEEPVVLSSALIFLGPPFPPSPALHARLLVLPRALPRSLLQLLDLATSLYAPHAPCLTWGIWSLLGCPLLTLPRLASPSSGGLLNSTSRVFTALVLCDKPVSEDPREGQPPQACPRRPRGIQAVPA